MGGFQLPRQLKTCGLLTMVAEHPTQIPEPRRCLAAILSLSFAWPIPIFFWLTPKIDQQPGLLLMVALLWWIIGVLVVLANRRAPWSVQIWIPLVVAPVALLLITLLKFEWHSSSGPGAPLEGVATLFGLLFVVVCGVLLVLTILARPGVYRSINLASALINTALVSVSLSATYSHSTRLDIILTLLDPAGKPVPQASVSFKGYRYGPEGRHVFAGTKGPYLTDLQGTVVLPTQRLRYETQIAISKPQHRELLATLGMQFDADEAQRQLTLSTRETRAIASIHVPVAEPLPVTLVLPPISDAPDPNLKRLSFRSTQDSSPLPDRYLDIETGTLNRELTENSDLELEVTGSYSETTLHLRGLRGILLKTTDSQTPRSYESLYRIAPPDGYSPTIQIKKPGDSPPQTMVYMRLPSGDRYARMSITAIGDGLHSRIRFKGQIHLNESGSRLLE
jgi:hypothetical protein